VGVALFCTIVASGAALQEEAELAAESKSPIADAEVLLALQAATQSAAPAAASAISLPAL